MDRRTFVKGVAVGSAAGLAGCIGSGDDVERVPPAEHDEFPPDEYESQLNIWSWYVDWTNWAMSAFMDEYDVTANFDPYAAPPEWFSTLEQGDHAIDNISSTVEWAQRAVDQDMVEELPTDIVPNYDNIDEIYRQPMEETFGVGENVYAYPHVMQISPGIVYNTEVFDEPPGWDILWDDEFADEMVVYGGIPSTACAPGVFYTGQDPNDPDDFEEIKEVMIQQKPNNVTYGMEHESTMQMFVNEEAVVGSFIDGRAMRARFEHDAPISFSIPEGGASYDLNNLFIPTGSPNPSASLLYLNFLLSVEAQLEFVKATKARTTLDRDLIEEEFAGEIDDAHIDELVLTDEEVDNLVLYNPSQEVTERYDEIWTEIEAA